VPNFLIDRRILRLFPSKSILDFAFKILYFVEGGPFLIYRHRFLFRPFWFSGIRRLAFGCCSLFDCLPHFGDLFSPPFSLFYTIQAPPFFQKRQKEKQGVNWNSFRLDDLSISYGRRFKSFSIRSQPDFLSHFSFFGLK